MFIVYLYVRICLCLEVLRLFVNYSSGPVQVVIYTECSKCVLMENGPSAHFDACFYDGEPYLMS